MMQWKKLLPRRFKDENGNIAVLSALTATVIFMFAAFGVDEASIYFDDLTLQGSTDIAAIVAANNLTKAQSAAELSLQDNNVLTANTNSTGNGNTGGGAASADVSVATVKVEIGRYSEDADTPIAQRFSPASDTANAARVTVTKTSQLFFAAYFSTPPKIQTVAVARKQTLGSFSLGSRVASLNGGVLNGILSGILGTNLSLSVLDYQSLAGANVDLLKTMDALAAKKGITVGTYDSLLANSISYTDLASTLSGINTLSPSVSGILRNISQQTSGSNVNVPLSGLFGLGDIGKLAIGQPHGGVQLGANVLDMLNAGALLGGSHQIALDLGTTIPGIASTTLNLQIGEPPPGSAWLTAGETGTMVFTADTRLRLIAQVGGTGLLSGMMIRLPLYIDVASAQGTLSDVQCTASNAPQSMSVAVQPGLVGAWIGEVGTGSLSDFTNSVPVSTATLISAPLLKVTGSAQTQMGNTTPTTVNFSANDISNHTVKTVSTSNYTSSLTSSLLGKLNIQVNALGLGLNLSAVTSALNGILSPLTPTLDKVIANVLTLVGVKVGQADAWANGVDCASAVLVQ